jgi:ABC-2 type transport system permease protein
MLGIPLGQLILFGYAINNESQASARSVALVDDQPRPLHPRTMVHGAGDDVGLLQLRLRGEQMTRARPRGLFEPAATVSFVVTVPAGFARRVERGDHPQILIEADATDPCRRLRCALAFARHRSLAAGAAARPESAPPTPVRVRCRGRSI